MKAMHPAAIWCAALLATVHSVPATPVFQDDFAAGSSTNWATRFVNGASVQFSGALILTTDVSNVQPVAAYRSFPAISLEEGNTLRLSVDVATSVPGDSPRAIRIALGYADPAIEGHSSLIDVPLAGYHMSAPINGSEMKPRVSWVRSDGAPVSFFNSETAMLGDLKMATQTGVTTSPKTLVMEITRLGNVLAISGSLDGIPFPGAIEAADENVIPSFRFNTIGLSFGFEEGSTATYDNVSVEILPPS
jgi:hypothetical protein